MISILPRAWSRGSNGKHKALTEAVVMFGNGGGGLSWVWVWLCCGITPSGAGYCPQGWFSLRKAVMCSLTELQCLEKVPHCSCLGELLPTQENLLRSGPRASMAIGLLRKV